LLTELSPPPLRLADRPSPSLSKGGGARGRVGIMRINDRFSETERCAIAMLPPYASDKVYYMVREIDT
jgi:hypothetical protein